MPFVSVTTLTGDLPLIVTDVGNEAVPNITIEVVAGRFAAAGVLLIGSNDEVSEVLLAGPTA